MFISHFLGARISLAIAWLMVCVCCGSAMSADDKAKKGDLLLLLESSEYGDQVEAQRIINRYDFSYTADYRIVPRLIAITQKQFESGEEYYSMTPRNLAIRALGKLRAREAVPVLIERLVPNADQVLVMDQLMHFGHAGYSLIEIGPPAVRPLLDKIRTEGDSALGNDCVKIVVGIIGIEEVRRLASPHLIKQLENPDSVIVFFNKLNKAKAGEEYQAKMMSASKTKVSGAKYETEVVKETDGDAHKPTK